MVTQSTHDCNLRRLFWESLLDHGWPEWSTWCRSS
jgi:hypothetical protein